MKTNFSIKCFREIQYDGREIDLHNNFDLVTVEHSVEHRSVTLNWIKSTEDWAIAEEYQKLTIVHKGVSFFTILYEYKA